MHTVYKVFKSNSINQRNAPKSSDANLCMGLASPHRGLQGPGHASCHHKIAGTGKTRQKMREKKTGNECALVEIIYDWFVRTTWQHDNYYGLWSMVYGLP